MTKHAGALMSSRLMPPTVGSRSWQKRMTSSGSSEPTSRSKTSMPAKRLKRTPLPSMTGFDGQRPDVAQPQHGRAVRDDRDQVAAGRVLEDVLGIRVDLPARLGHARRVGEREVTCRGDRLGGHDFDLSGTALRVVVEGFLAAVRHDDGFSESFLVENMDVGESAGPCQTSSPGVD